MQKRLTKILSVLLLALTFVFGNNVFVVAEEKATYVSTETIEMRTEGKVGLRIISSIDKAYFDKQTENGKNITYGTVAVPATVLEASGRELELGGVYKYNNKNYKVLNIPAENNWKVTEDKISFTAVLTGIKGAGFNTRYAVRSYIKVDGVVTYGDTLIQSSYTATQNMLSSQTVSTDSKAWLASNVIDACDDAKKVTQDKLTITSADLKNGTYTLGATEKVRNYKKVIIDSSVKNGEVILKDIRIRNLEIEEGTSGTITAENTSFDQISKNSIGKSRSTGNLVLNLGTGSNVAKLSATSNMTVNGDLKIAKITVDEKVTNFVINAPAEKLTVSEEAEESNITVNSKVENAVINGDNSTIGGNGKLDKVQDNGNNQVKVEIGKEIPSNNIVSVEVRGMNRMIVTLEKATKDALTVDDMKIMCRGGKDMTILNVTTEDNKVYTVSTSIFAKDDTYTFSIELEEGKVIQKEFSYKVNCPTVSDATVLRSEATRAEFDLFDVDEGGYVYVYIPGHTQISRAAEEAPSVETVKKGYKKEIKTGFNKVVIDGLQEEISYKLYYIMESHDGRISDVLGPITINGGVEEDPNISNEYKIVSVGESPKNTITIELNKAPKETLSLDNFSFICPKDSAITIDKAKLTISEDRKKYTIVIPENYGHKDNQYTAKVTFSDGTVAKKTFVVEFTPPRITEQKIERISETKVRYSFRSDKDGVIYYGTYNFNGSYNSENNTPTGSQIIKEEVKSTKVELRSGYNKIEFEYNGTDKDIFALHVDKNGNYASYTEHHNIPVYVPPVKPEDTKVEIKSIVYNNEHSWYPCLDITFNTEIDYLPNDRFIELQVISGSSLPPRLMWSKMFIDEDHKRLCMSLMNGEFKTGAYKISMRVYKDNKLVKVEKEFVID